MRPEPPRDRWGRYLLDGRAWVRVTTLAAAVEDRWNLERWAKRQVALGLAGRQDLLVAVAAARDDTRRLDELVERAMEAAAADAGARTGSALHSLTADLDDGLEVSAPAPYDADLAAYRETLAACGVEVVPGMVERVVLNRRADCAGTLDRIVQVRGWPKPVVADLKTGAFLSWPAVAVQLALYAHAEEMWDPTQDRLVPMPEVDRDRALVVHLPAGTADCTLHEVDLRAGWEAAVLALGVRRWQKRRDLARPFVPPGERRREHLRLRAWRVSRAGGADALRREWPDGVPSLRRDGHSDEQLARVEALLVDLEARLQLPFWDDEEAERCALRMDVEALRQRLDATDPEVVEEVRRLARAERIPNLASEQATAEHVARVGELLAAVEADRARRGRRAKGAAP